MKAVNPRKDAAAHSSLAEGNVRLRPIAENRLSSSLHPMWNGLRFNGTKIALLRAGAVVAYQRDNKEDIPWPGLWDLPGGGREGDESPIECALREVEEEFGIRLPHDRVTDVYRYDGAVADTLPSYFCLAIVTQAEIDQIEFGDEGQRWQVMDALDFIHRQDAVPHMQERLARHWNVNGAPTPL